MKKLLLILVLFVTVGLKAQTDGLSYQAVIVNPTTQELPGVNASGNIFPNKSLSVRFTISNSSGIEYQEEQSTSTDAYGMISLTIGQGSSMGRTFTEINWDGAQKELKVEINLDGGFKVLSVQPLLYVPFALHRDITATGNLIVEGDVGFKGELEVDGATTLNNTLDVTNGSATNLTGTLNVDGATDVNNTLTVDGATTLNNTLDVTNGSATNLTGTLNVDGATDVNNTLTVDGATTLNNTLDVTNASATNLTGTLNVDGATDVNNTLTVDGATTLNNTLDVTNASATNLTGTLNVDGATDVNNTLTVDGATTLNNTLDVTGGSATNLTGTLNVDGATTLEMLVIKTINVQSSQATYVATFENTNNGNGDGINIKLGKAKTSFTKPNIPGLSPTQLSQIKNLINCNYTGPKITLLKNIVIEGVQADVEMIAGLTVGIGNMLVGQINTELGLPITTPRLAIPTISVPSLYTPKIDLEPIVTIPRRRITAGFPILSGFELLPAMEVMPKLPEITLAGLGIAEIKINNLEFWGVPNLCFTDSGSPLNNQNEFLRFSDNANAKMGSIRAVSLSDWSSDYLNPAFLFKLRGALTSAVDKKHAQYHFKSEISSALKDYAAIGVEYSSGNGDYAEWLERINPNEAISTGDIVAVKGGKITKDLTDAEQVMAVSHRPIVLGNVPEEGKNHLGNNIAFMGQIPVKIMGSVVAGDYIVAKSNIVGYGIAISPEDMILEDFKLVVGRSWDTNSDSGPKMVNTVIGVHNGDYINILKRYEQKIKKSEARLNSVEAKVDALSELIKSKSL